MLRWALVFLIISVIAAVFGFSGLSNAASDVAQVLFYIFLGVFALTLLAGLIAGDQLPR
ncbi:Uncharacterized membrane protein YtjA, UPF0391 family [Nannocystis exedens]|uniref:Uncharacterized membrane protein YtjA, UPF0391 family n=1 Tax=Nannocystis exedens TaxID=54 RepID=A0A1I2BBW5_9BACT|nr:DUF1328 domain-containing protein [Nannocystis exedens]PCC68068.1 membrane protein [Nannocystis exedens]SFE53559.1 Uncharacterized membrane protein YtjA, UPF0391 family [Nannocystis exedens]